LAGLELAGAGGAAVIAAMWIPALARAIAGSDGRPRIQDTVSHSPLGPPRAAVVVVPLASVVLLYLRHVDEDRLEQGPFLLEALRTRELIQRYAPAAPATVVDIGGAAGAYALWLAEAGYTVHLLDPVPCLAGACSLPRSHAGLQRWTVGRKPS